MLRATVTLGTALAALVGQGMGQNGAVLADSTAPVTTMPADRAQVRSVQIVPMPTEATLIRSALEECNNAKDAEGPGVGSVAFNIPLPDGSIGTIRCAYGSTGQVRVTIGVKPGKSVRYRANGGGTR